MGLSLFVCAGGDGRETLPGGYVEEEFSEELLRRMERLTVKQRRAVPAIVRARAEGRSWESLFRGEGKVCAKGTFWRRGRGWWHQELFREVLAQAQREYDAAVLRTSVQDAAEGLRRTAPLAVEGLRDLVVGMVAAVGEMRSLVEDENPGLLEKEGGALRFRAADKLVGQGVRAAVAVLDRADIETAVKGMGGADERFAALLVKLQGLGSGRETLPNGE